MKLEADYTVSFRATVRSMRMALCAALVAALSACVSPPPPAPPPAPPEPPPKPVSLEPAILETRTGLASYYHPSLHGLETASGLPYDDNALMAAHPDYPLGSVVRVTNLENGTSVEVDITDRGPTQENVDEGVIIDLSGAAAKSLGMLEDGRVRVKVDVIYWGANERARAPSTAVVDES